MISDTEHLFIYLLAVRMSLEKCLIKTSVHFKIRLLLFFLLLSCGSSLYVINICSFSDPWFANIFPYFIGCPFTLLFPWLCRSFTVWCSPTCLFIFACAFVISKDLCQEDFLLRFLLGFLVPGFMFKSLICFKLIFIYDIRKGLNFIILCVDI